MDSNSNTCVLVTGGTGFLGAHCVHQLLNKGFKVKTTIRSLKKKKQLVTILTEAGTSAMENLIIVEADLSKDTNWDVATAECDYVLHVASPFPLKMPKNEQELIKPAVDGTLRVLKAAQQNSVKKVVLTSSFAAVGYTHKDERVPITEADWSNPNDNNISAYSKSKTLAEKAAWDFVKKEENNLILTTICPRWILGPALGSYASSSISALKQLYDGSMKAVPNISYGIVDVRDVANLHILAMTNPKADGERFLASVDDLMSFYDVAVFLKNKLGDKAKKVTTKVYPNWLVRLIALFNSTAKGITPHLGKKLITINDKPIKVLGWNPRSREEAILSSIAWIDKN